VIFVYGEVKWLYTVTARVCVGYQFDTISKSTEFHYNIRFRSLHQKQLLTRQNLIKRQNLINLIMPDLIRISFYGIQRICLRAITGFLSIFTDISSEDGIYRILSLIPVYLRKRWLLSCVLLEINDFTPLLVSCLIEETVFLRSFLFIRASTVLPSPKYVLP